MKALLSSIVALFALSCNQQSTKVPEVIKQATAKPICTNCANVIDADGKRQGHWIVLNSRAHLAAGYADADKVEEGDYKNDMKEGKWFYYFPGGKIDTTIVYEGDKPISQGTKKGIRN